MMKNSLIIDFDFKKAVQVVGELLRLAGGKMDARQLLAMLYVLERNSLEKRGRPFLGGTILATEYGPVHAEALALIQGMSENGQD